MKKNRIIKIIWIILFIGLLTLVLYRANTVLSEKYIKSENIIKRKNLALDLPQDSIDVFFLGSSGLFSGVSPNNIWRNEKIKSFNFSSSDQPYIVRYYNILDLIDRQKPKLIVMDISSLNKHDLIPTEASYEVYFRKGYVDIQDEDLKKQYLKDLEDWFPDFNTLDYRVPLLRFHSSWSDIDEDNFKDYEDPEGYTNFLMGGLLSSSIEELEFDSYDGEEEFEPSEFNAFYAEKIIEFTRENDIELLFLITPKTKSYRDKDLVAEEFAKKHGVNFINFSDKSHMEKMDLDLKQDFYNWGHLNIWGNKKFSSYLASIISDLYPDLANNMEDSQFWKRSLKFFDNYQKQLEEDLIKE